MGVIMLKLFSFLTLLLCLNSASGTLNESTKPSEIKVYLEQNLPYSGFNAQHRAYGLLVDYWQQWSHSTGIAVKYHPYRNQPLAPLLSANPPAVYSSLQGEPQKLSGLVKTSFLPVYSQFYYRAARHADIKSSIMDGKATVVVGGLLPQAQQLAFLAATPGIIYKEYPGLLELLLDIYSENIDALVLFTGQQQASSLVAHFLSLLFSKLTVTDVNNALFIYTSEQQNNLLEWIRWGNQFEGQSVNAASLIAQAANPVWGTSAEMASKILIFIIFLVLLFIFNQSRRKKDQRFKDILDSSPYPLAIFSLDGRIIFYLNDEVKYLFPFKKTKKKYAFEEAENQLLLSRFINKASHQISIEDKQLRLLVDGSFHDIEISAKRIHYQRQTAWFCYLKDITALLRAERKLTEERELLRKVLDSIPEQIAFKSPKGTIIGCNKSWAKVNNTTVAYATGRRLSDMLPTPTINKQKQQETLVWSGEAFNSQEWVQQKDRELSLINIVKLPLYNDKGSIFAILSIDNDITDLYKLNEKLKDENLQRKKTEKALSKQNVLLSSVFSASIDPIGLLDHDGRVIAANHSFAKLMGSTVEDIIGQLQGDFLSAEQAEWAERQNQQVLESAEPLIFDEVSFNDGKKMWYEVCKTPFKDSESDYKGIVIMGRDITLRKETEEKLSSEASEFEAKMLHDQLTRIANRRAFDMQFSKLWQEACDEQELLSLVICDIDFFKKYNDNYGHQKGDQALLGVATALQTVCDKAGCFVARYGGEEFAVLIKGGNATKALKVTENVREAVKKTQIEHLHSSVNTVITMSMGLSSMFPSELNSMKILLAEADSALYAAKESGRDQTSVH